MELNRDYIENVSFTCKRKKYYMAKEVDHFLDALAKDAEDTNNELNELREQVSALKSYQDQSEELEMFRARTEELQKKLDEKLLYDSTTAVTQATEQAREILSRASEESDMMLSETNNQRNRAIAASRAAYYNALQFKQELAKQYKQMEEDLDKSIDVLRTLDTPKINPIFAGATPVTFTPDTKTEG